MRNLRFYKDPDSRWYVDLPEWEGEKADLEMVAGADSMLEYMSGGEADVTLSMSESEFTCDCVLQFVRLAEEYQNGAFYKMDKYRGIDVEIEMWLCDVTKFVFGRFPERIYVSVVS